MSQQLHNSPQLWNTFWGRLSFSSGWTGAIESLYRTNVYFYAFNDLLTDVSLANSDILELGSGVGSNSRYLARHHGTKSVTLVDFSERVLAMVRTKQFSCKVTAIKHDIFTYEPGELFDFVHSAGLIEHFYGEERFLAVQAHARCAKKGGLVMIWVPVRSVAFSMIGKLNRAMSIREIPLTEQELRDLCAKSGLTIIAENHCVFGALYGILARKI
jgi:2-polyprenyl-3-methyl-5-hydroxy-6-metoxy-1,4-benzoquinol methylase